MPETPNPSEHQTQHTTQKGSGLPPLQFDPDDYRAELKELNLTREQEDEFLVLLWNLISHFVDIGFGIEATQLVIAAHFAECFETENGEDGDL